jgi:negative regulator of flagellin synthesis FlgM
MNVQNDLQGIQQILTSANPSGGARTPAIQDATGASAPGDEAHLSAAAHLAAKAIAAPEVNTEKVAGVQAALADGSYHVSSSEVADKLIAHMQTNQH